jgi:hypothetical protein
VEVSAKLESVIARLHQLPPAEVDLIDFILEGIESGVDVYGRFDPATDKRDLPFEAAKEFRDAFVYFAGDFLKKTLARRQRIECFRKDLEHRTKNVEATFEVRDGKILEILPPGEVMP